MAKYLTQDGKIVVLPHWDMVDKDDETKNTHLWIVNRAFEMAYQALDDLPLGPILKSFYETNSESLHQGLWDADNKAPYDDPTVFGIRTYKSHFYDPDTEENWMNERYPTALTQGVTYFKDAVEAYIGGNKSDAAYYLGLSLHYATDIGQPMHAANFTNLDLPTCYHAYFERYVIVWTNKNKPANINYTGSLKSSDPGDFIKATARLAKTWDPDLTSNRAIAAAGPTISDCYPKAWTDIVDPIIGLALINVRDFVSQYIVLWAELAISTSESPWVHMNLTTSAKTVPANGEAFSAFADSVGGPRPVDRVFYLDLDQNIHHLKAPFLAPESWSDTKLTPIPNCPAVSANKLLGFVSGSWRSRQIAFIAVTDGSSDLWELTGGPTTGWFPQNISAMVSPKPSIISSYTAFDFWGGRQYAFLSDIGEIESIYCLVSGIEWSLQNLTHLSNADPASFDSPLLSSGSSITGNPFAGWCLCFFNTAGHIGQIEQFNPSAAPQYFDLSERTSAPLPDRNHLSSMPWQVPGTSTQNVFSAVYTGVDHHIHEIAGSGGNYQHTDLTKMADAPESGVRALIGYCDGLVATRRVAYIDSDGSIHILSGNEDGTWSHVNLTEVASCPPAASSIVGSVFASPITHRIVYIDGDGNVQCVQQAGSPSLRKRVAKFAAVEFDPCHPFVNPSVHPQHNTSPTTSSVR